MLSTKCCILQQRVGCMCRPPIHFDFDRALVYDDIMKFPRDVDIELTL